MAKKKRAKKMTKTAVCPPSACLSVRGFAISGGLLWGVGVLFVGLAALYIDGWGDAVVQLLESIYIGYEATPIGSLIGGIWGFVDGFVGCAVFAWLYNRFR